MIARWDNVEATRQCLEAMSQDIQVSGRGSKAWGALRIAPQPGASLKASVLLLVRRRRQQAARLQLLQQQTCELVERVGTGMNIIEVSVPVGLE